MNKINDILIRMSSVLSAEQMTILEDVLLTELHEKNELTIPDNRNGILINRFVAVKKMEGCTNATIKQYHYTVSLIVEGIGKPATEINTDDIRYYFMVYQKEHEIENTTYNNMVRYLSSFYNFLEDEDIIVKNPMRKIKNVKIRHKIKPVISASEMESLKQKAKVRDLAIIETLYSTGCRVSELASLDITDISNDAAVITGKGNKQRIVYFSGECMHYLKQYINNRTDNNMALFVSDKKPYCRLRVASIQNIVRKLGKKADIGRIHPHKFRRTVATDAMRRGMPIQEVQTMLGHSKIDTTMLYCMVDEDNVKNSHKRYVG